MPAETYQILIADDDPDCRQLVEVALTADDMKITVCEDGEKALSSFQTVVPDLVVLDVQMPGLSGIEVCQKIKAHDTNKFTPVILLTSQAELTHKLAGLNCGADDYVTKPFALPELEARVRGMLRIKDLTDELRRTQNLLAEKERELVAMQVAGAAAHELGQPLTSLLLNCQLLVQLGGAQPQLKEILSAVTAESVRMRDIVKRLNEVQSYKVKDYTDNLAILDLGLETPNKDTSEPDSSV